MSTWAIQFWTRSLACVALMLVAVNAASMGAQRATIYSFSNGTNDGGNPLAGLTVGSDGALYGTTDRGGVFGAGTVFRITTTGTFTLLHSFGATSTDGVAPHAPLLAANDGMLYGTTSTDPSGGAGSVFKISTAGVFTNIHSFGADAADGSSPDGGLVQAADGNLYGATTWEVPTHQPPVTAGGERSTK